MGSAKTRFSLSTGNPLTSQADGLIIPVFKKADAKASSPKGSKNAETSPDAIVWPERLDRSLLDELKAIAHDEKFDAGRGKTLMLRGSKANKLGIRRLILLGLGEAVKLKPRHWETNLLKAISNALALKDAQSIAIQLPGVEIAFSSEVAISLAVDAATQATYKSTEAKDPVHDLKTVTLFMESGSSKPAPRALQEAEALAQARTLVKDLVNRPANLKTTDTLVETAQNLGKGSNLKVTIQKDVRWIEKNMPCFFTVARGSLATDAPKFITLRYTPKSGKAKKHIAVIGKSVIFDTGGYQVKPGDYMVTMKGDMTGGAVALATMQAIADLELKNIEVSAYLAATPNKIDSDAMIPDSIVDTSCGKKVEIRHTDAEGRLTLIDAVTQAMSNKPDEILTIATLTGSASAAVGSYIALMGSNDDLRSRVQQAGQSLGEPIQTLDVTEDDYDNIKSKLDGADIINTSQRKNRGAQTAAAFVMSGAPEGTPMAHMDIAGADMTPDEKATGTSVKTVIQYLLNEDALLNSGTAPSRPTSLGSGNPIAPQKATPDKAKPTKAPPAQSGKTAKTTTSATRASKSPAKGKSTATNAGAIKAKTASTSSTARKSTRGAVSKPVKKK